MPRVIKEPNYPALLLFGTPTGSREYVVIATEGPLKEHQLDGYTCIETKELDDTGLFPTDRPLHKSDF